MPLPFFYISSYEPGQAELMLDEDNSRHIVQVLRMKPGDPLQLTDGQGNLLTTVVLDDHKKKCRVKIQSTVWQPPRKKKVAIAISLLKNASRFEWFLEKATEIGVTDIIPLFCERTERQHFRQDRLQNILVSAILQSQQVWLPSMPPPMPFTDLVGNPGYEQIFIAHCLEEKKTSLTSAEGGLVLIGPEGDFSPKEIESAIQHRFLPVTLGERRLRTETAGIVAATLLCI